MSSVAATALALLLYALAFAPIAWLAFHSGSAKWVAALGGAAILALGLFQTGIFSQGSLASTDVARLLQLDSSDSRCQQVFDLLITNGVMLEPPARGQLVVRGADWDAMPEAVREAIVACVDPGDLPEGQDAPEVIRR